MNIKVLGYGGAFDVEEGNSSFLVNHMDKNYLIDCGWDVFPKLKRQNLINDIDTVCITHCHDDHIGSLSALIYYNFFVLKKVTNIFTSYNVFDDLKQILKINGHSDEQINFVDDESLYSLSTLGLHQHGMPSCGILFKNKDLKAELIISGDLSKPLLDIYHRDIFSDKINENTIFLHEATNFKSPVHCYYEDLETWPKELRNNLYLYHHSSDCADFLESEGFKTVKTLKNT